MSFAEIENFLWAGISFFAFLLTCGTLVESRFGRKGSILISAGLLTGLIALQAGLILSGQDQTLVLTMLPMTAYLPAMIGVHIVSKARFFQTIAIWTLGLLVSYTLTFLQKILLLYVPLSGSANGLVIPACLLFSACLFLLIVFHYIRKPFRSYVLHNNTNWLPLCFPTVMIFLLFSYFKNSTTNRTVWILLFLTALSIFLVVARSLVSSASALRMQEAEKAISAQLAMQRKEYEDICKKMELGRTYRHDMRHHLTVLGSLASGKNNEEIAKYISNLDEQIVETEHETYCENATVNAVLRSYIGQAKKEGCAVTANVQIPSAIPFDALDICAVLANALENAIHACQHNSDAEDRKINLNAVFEDSRKLIISICNPCEDSIRFDKDGLPIVPKQEGHGLGLKSINMIAEKYNGLFQCECVDGFFQIRTVLFDSQETPLLPKEVFRPRKAVTATLMSLFIFCFAVNCVPALQALAEVPILGNLIRVVDFRSYDSGWGDTEAHLDLPKVELTEAQPPVPKSEDAIYPTESETQATTAPESIQEETQIPSPPSGTISWESGGKTNSDSYIQVPSVVLPEQPSSESPPTSPTPESPPDLSEGVEDINRQMEEYIQSLREKFLWYVARKYNGYVAMDATYTTLRNDDKLLLIRFDTTLNVGGSGTYSRCFMLDKQSGKVVELWELFKENSDYIGVVSSEILRQMTEQVNAGLADYFIPGGIWSEEECFKKIAADQNFYINDKNQLVIVFDEYEVAPGKDGRPEFILPTERLTDILWQPSLLK